MQRGTGRPLRLVCVALILVVGMALGGYWVDKLASREEREEAAVAALRHRAESLVAAVSEQSRALVLSVDLALLQMAANYRSRGRIDGHDLAILRAAFPEDMLQAIVVVGADGFVKFASEPLAGPVWLRDHPAFTAHAAATAPALYIGPTMRGLHGQWVVPFSRPLMDPRGKFAGVVVVTVKPQYLGAAFDSIRRGGNDVIGLVHHSGFLIARTPEPEKYLGERVRADRPFLRPDAPATGSFRAPGSFQEVERMFAYRRIAGDKLIAVVGLSVAAALAAEHAADEQDYESGVLVSALTGVLLFAICAVLLRLERNQLRQHDTDRLLGMALAEARELAWYWNAESDMVVVQGNLHALLGLPGEHREMPADDWSAYIHPEDRPAAAVAWLSHLEGAAAVYQCEYRVRLADGSYRWVLTRGSATERDSFGRARRIAGILIDIDRDKQAQLTIAHLNARYQRLIDAAGQGILVVDRDGRLELMNPAAEAMLGWPLALARGQRAHDLFHEGPVGAAGNHPWYECPLYLSLLEGSGRRDDRATFWRRDGSALPVELRIAPLLREGENDGAIVVFDDVSERLQREDYLERLARTDTLTGVANRRQFIALSGHEIKRAKREGRPLAVLMIDIDHFKATNDLYGHAAGDQVLVAMAAACISELREVDVFGRLGGEEFGAVLPGAPAEEAQAIAERLRVAVERLELPYAGQVIRCSVSIGIATWAAKAGRGAEGGDGVSFERLLAEADKALYQAKATGRNRVVMAAA